MKHLLVTAFSLLCFTAAFAQVKISSPYEYGQTSIKIVIAYPTSITVADSTVLEVNYGGEAYERVTGVKGLSKELSQGYTNKDRFNNRRIFRVAVYQKSKPVVYSNETEVYYQPQFTYSDAGLPSVTNLKATVIEKEGKRYLHFTWAAVPGAAAYRLFIESGSMIWEASIGDQGYFYTTSYDYLLETTGERTYVFGVGAVEGPDDNTDVPKLVNKVTIKVPAAY
ncbi:hypothetical protein [Cytophaga hutchinsonii]|uniref:Uncharacterized protein n=1 Tax=Cytophaga hutchinsonii (strain ATCC 33406 / DSM 1761 / CIP 103989 / NBRC 15051 / NCIMB 9469 / D465) TaxID=269798 RepID=A0A6N4STL8_CYTH3|nr:hypothetical protein [Cytophaga hutchinsonii]ABG59652.1 hypothetical protein CHU_2396 [Cytophaga hutchinsonii ATCC 33406]SFX66538.1 hypothetical protein SAMN04487930_107137 [Cytophaga hutchinsonii ATCC 33406]